jgi:hypothetical protein
MAQTSPVYFTANGGTGGSGVVILVCRP